MNMNCCPLSSKQMTPKKRSNNKSLKSTPNKGSNTPSKTRSPRSSRTLPKSPISQTMKQSTINDFFKPVSPSIQSIESFPSNSIQSKPSKDRNMFCKPLTPIFGSIKRNTSLRSSLRIESNLKKKLKTNELNNTFNDNDYDNKSLTNDNSIDMSQTNQSLYFTANDISFETQVMKQSFDQVSDQLKIEQKTDQILDESIDKMMDSMKIDGKDVIKVSHNQSQDAEKLSKVPELSFQNNMLSNHNSNDCQSVKVSAISESDEKMSFSSDDEMDVSIFKVPESVIQKNKSKIDSNKYVNKEKQKQTTYLLNNLCRINRDKQMLAIEPFAQNNQNSENETFNENSDINSSDFRKYIEGIDIFGEYIPKTFCEDSVEKPKYDDLSENLQNLYNLPLNRLSTLVPIFMTKLDDTERELIIFHTINLVSNEENALTFNKIATKTIKILCKNDLEIKLSSIVREFCHILYTNSLKFKDSSPLKTPNKKSSEKLIEKTAHSISNVLKILSQVLNMCSFKFEGISIEEELIKLLLIGFSLGLENRLIEDHNWFYTLKQFIAVVIENILLNELNISHIINNLLSFIKPNDCINIGLSLRIVSLIPLKADFSLKRQFCISVIKLFISEDISDQTFDFSFNDIQNIIIRIEWKKLSLEEIHGIIQLISLSLDLPNDLMDNKDIISQILSSLTFEINKCIPNATDFKYSDIHQLLVVLRSKVLASS